MKRIPVVAGVILSLFSFLTVQCQARDTAAYQFDPSDTTLLVPTKKLSEESQIVVGVLNQAHYRKQNLNDSLSSVIFDNYLSSLDGSKVYFLQEDIDRFEKYRYKIDDYLKKGDLSAAYDIYNTFRKRFSGRMDEVDSLVQLEYDFTLDEYYETDRENAKWAASDAELDELWRKVIKSQALSLMLADKEWADIHETLDDRYERMARFISQNKPIDVFQVYMNAFTESYDPHTAYFSPRTAENFKINMSQSLEGIGASLQQDGDYTKVADVIAGGPAFTSKLIFKDDRIVGVAQGEDGEMVDVIGWRLDDVVQLIRGEKGTTVRLNILRAKDGAGALPVEISLVRDKIKLENERPRKTMVPYTENGKTYQIGIITIPSFYMNFEEAQAGNPNYGSTTRDVRKLITELEADGMDALLIDLTYNGGGSLPEAIELSGLFIPEGPVVQVRNSDGSVETGDDPDPKTFYEGPLGVVVNRFSASASEIFAGAIQDYKRGVVIGEQTFGKGTVQNLLDLDRIARTDEKLGQLKLTLAKFYRVTGSSTQHKGVTPDIQLPSEFSGEEFGESSYPAALPWDQIKDTDFVPVNAVTEDLIAELRAHYQQRLKTDEELIDLVEDIEAMKEARKDTRLSLNLAERKKELKELESMREELLEEEIGSELEAEEPAEEKEPLEEKDPYIKESVRILGEMIDA
ncbi:carboxy terminal-processing peptidase [Nafulsella turpanensis]|uniref:carboxy terminal-processing peptidase n=1 Tax=Nafulsella turpanensis TaxID=1265690 RepID=UPI000348B05E|nr:carboxy terminal-processing peptidase [Nafulsella turpanensis]